MGENVPNHTNGQMNCACQSRRGASSPDERDQFSVQPVLGQAMRRAGTQSLRSGLVPLISQQPENTRPWVNPANTLDCFDTAAGGKIKVHQRNMRPVPAVQFERLFGVSDRSNQLHVGLHANQRGKSVPQQRVVIHRENANLICVHSPQISRQRALRTIPKSGAEVPPIFRGTWP